MRTGHLLAVAALVVAVGLGGTSAAAQPVTRQGDAAAARCPESGGPHLPIPGPGVSRELLFHLHCLLVSEWEYSLVWDGVFSAATRRAVASHQRDCHIPVTGTVNPETWVVLHPETTTAECADPGRD